ncbi:MAG: secondary thiamine-phosphate synthase enzyme YjbQ [Oscillospiraceae bacterium]|nr:secondary thiamine-phosphate synthase enzyme YjbQ [Oscillospiraceae bacterium]
MNLYKNSLSTGKEGFYDITHKVKECLTKSSVKDGICVIFCPHTTAGITINENTDANVPSDILLGLKNAFKEDPNFKHFEGNSLAHLKSSVIGCEKTLIVENSELVLGTWQGIFFCEFDGPRKRNFYVKIL